MFQFVLYLFHDCHTQVLVDYGETQIDLTKIAFVGGIEIKDRPLFTTNHTFQLLTRIFHGNNEKF